MYEIKQQLRNDPQRNTTDLRKKSSLPKIGENHAFKGKEKVIIKGKFNSKPVLTINW